jgi:hypothetical protein
LFLFVFNNKKRNKAKQTKATIVHTPTNIYLKKMTINFVVSSSSFSATIILLWISLFLFVTTNSVVVDAGSVQAPQNHRLLQRDTPDGNTNGAEEEEDDTVVRTDLVRLTPFDVQIALNVQSVDELESLEVTGFTNVITDWMSDSFTTKSKNPQIMASNSSTVFDSVALELVEQKIQTSSTSNNQIIALFTTSYNGVSLWERYGSTTPPMDPAIVELMQRATFLEDNALLQSLQSVDPTTLGLAPAEDDSQLIDVRAFITPAGGDESANNPTQAPTSDSNQNLQIIIIIAIVVACLAFGLLVFAVVWAWRSDHKKSVPPSGSKASGGKKSMASTDSKKKTRSFRKEQSASSPGQQQEEVKAVSAVPKEIYNNSTPLPHGGDDEKMPPPSKQQTAHIDYDESVVSEDAEESSASYYKPPGMMMYNSGRGGHAPAHELNDAASMSSMDSYGYSLDGYAPSLGTAQGGYPVGPLRAAKDIQVTVGDDDEDYDAAAAAAVEELEDYEAQA